VLPLEGINSGLLSERELHAKTNDGVVVFAVADHIIRTVSEDAEAASTRDAEVKATTDEEVSVVVAVGAVTTADHGVRGQAKAGDWVTKHQSGVEVMMLGVRGVEAIGTLDRDVFAEGVFGEDTATENVFFTKESTTKSAEGEARSEALTAGRGWRWHHGSLRVFVGDGASKSSASDSDCSEEGNE
jgi:hypothetical protein